MTSPCDEESAPLMPVRRLHNYVYCPRLFYLQWVENIFVENADTAEGDSVHSKVDEPSRLREDALASEGGALRSIALSSEQLGISGVVDLLEADDGGANEAVLAFLPRRFKCVFWVYNAMSRRRRYLICYDIADAKRLRRTAKVCESYGSRLQFSVFESSLDDLMLKKLQAELDSVINHSCDQILFVDMGADDETTPLNIAFLGLPYLKRSRITII